MTFMTRSGMTAHGVGAMDFSSIGKSLGTAAIQGAADTVAAVPAYRSNRARMAALIEMGYSSVDTYAAMRPGIFMASLAGFIASSYGLAKRKSKCAEAKALYPLLMMSTGVLAWFTRPDWFLAANPAVENVDPNAPTSVKQALGFVDRRVIKLSSQYPGWEGATLSRLWGDVGSGTMAPVVRTLLTKNTH